MVIGQAKAGKEAVELALQVLKDFYQKAALVQGRAGYVPPDSDRSGKTVEDLAPEGFDSSKYAGRQDSSEGILGLLEVILADFDRTGTTVDADEKMSAQEFKEFKSSVAQDTLDGALSELEKLHSICVAGEETFEERVAKREKEIEALKEAHAILEAWQASA